MNPLLESHSKTFLAEATIGADGALILPEALRLPLSQGERVSLTISVMPEAGKTSEETLRGTVLKYDLPFEPATALEDWGGVEVAMQLDTHIWIWWVNGDAALDAESKELIAAAQATGLYVSIFSCWEVAKLVENKRLVLSLPVDEWIAKALTYPGVQLVPLTLPIIIDATRLPGDFHRDPADQILVATARVNGYAFLTKDEKILKYPHIKLATNTTNTE